MWGCLPAPLPALAPTSFFSITSPPPPLQGLAEREAITVIVDDSHSVWSQHRHNLVAVERYVYFPSSRASLGLKGPSLLDANRCGGGQGRGWGLGTVWKGCGGCARHVSSHGRLASGGWQCKSLALLRAFCLPCPLTSICCCFPASLLSLAACRDECPEQGMLMVALDVLGRVHAAVMEALRAAPLTLPGGEVVYQNWDVRQALAQERQKVGRAGGLGRGWLAEQCSLWWAC